MISVVRANLPVVVVIIPLFIAFVLSPLANKLKLVERLVMVAVVLGAVGTIYLSYLVLSQNGQPIIYQLGGWPAPWGIELKAGNLSVFFLIAVFGISLPISLFSLNDLSHDVGDKGRITRFYVLYLLLVGALAGMALTNDLFNVFVLVEVATLSCCGLVSASRRPQAAYAAFKYLILATLGSAFILAGIGFIYIVTGHLNMGYASLELTTVWQKSPQTVWMALSFFLVGFGVKSALYPLHAWLPDAHSTAPAPASAILSGLAVKGYIICFLKILYSVFGQTLMKQFTVHKMLTIAGALAIIAGSIHALAQKNLKERLAYSTIAQVGYIFIGLGLTNEKGLTGALFYLISHGVCKAALFLSAGLLISATGKQSIKELSGIGKKMPITMAAFTIGSLSLIGIPLLSGFLGKWHLILGGLEAGSILAVASIIIGSVLCAAYLLPVIRTAYFGPVSEDVKQYPGLAQKAALIMLAVIVMILGIFPGPVMELAKRAAAELLLL